MNLFGDAKWLGGWTNGCMDERMVHLSANGLATGEHRTSTKISGGVWTYTPSKIYVSVHFILCLSPSNSQKSFRKRRQMRCYSVTWKCSSLVVDYGRWMKKSHSKITMVSMIKWQIPKLWFFLLHSTFLLWNQWNISMKSKEFLRQERRKSIWAFSNHYSRCVDFSFCLPKRRCSRLIDRTGIFRKFHFFVTHTVETSFQSYGSSFDRCDKCHSY